MGIYVNLSILNDPLFKTGTSAQVGIILYIFWNSVCDWKVPEFIICIPLCFL